MSEKAEKLKVTTRTIEREMKKLRESGRIELVGGKRYGYWEKSREKRYDKNPIHLPWNYFNVHL